MEVTLITGASRGIGEALAHRFAGRKQNLLLVARNSGKLETLCNQLSEKHGIVAQYIAADLMNPEASEEIAADVHRRGLVVNCLINNAGIGSGGEFADLSLRSELDMMQLNMGSMVALTHLILADMRTRKSGTVVNVASMAAFMPAPYMAVYAATKAFVKSFTEALIEECKPYSIHVMLLCPGLTKTNFMDAAGLADTTGEALTSGAPLQTPDEVADEAMKGLDAHTHLVVSGTTNKWGARMMALVPNSVVTQYMAKAYRRKMGK